MSEIKKQLLFYKKTYVVLFVIILFASICDLAFIYQDEEVAFSRRDIEHSVELKIKERKAATGKAPEGNELLLDFSKNVYRQKADGDTVLSLFTSIVGIVLLVLFLKRYEFNRRIREFRRTLPIRQKTLQLQEYTVGAAVILCQSLLEGLVLGIWQRNYNGVVLEYAKETGDFKVSEAVLATLQGNLWGYVSIMLLLLLVIYSFLYLAATITKNPAAGCLIFWGIWGSMQIFVEVVLPFLGHCLYYSRMEEAVSPVWMNNQLERLRVWGWGMVSPDEFLNGVDMEKGTMAGYPMELGVGIYIVLLLLCIGFIVVVTERKDLTRGRLFYLPVLDYPFAILCGIYVFFLLNEITWYTMIEACIGIGIITTVIILFIIHPHSIRNRERWEVR